MRISGRRPCLASIFEAVAAISRSWIRQTRAASPQRPVLQRIGDAEQRHNSVAGEILDRAALILAARAMSS